MGKLTKAQMENLQHVLDHGHAKPRSNSGYWCRKNGLVEWLWLHTDGVIAAESERQPQQDALHEKIVGEVLTPAGRAALSQGEKP